MVSSGRPVAVLVGPPGSGKTVTGRALADLLGVPFHDTDEAIVARAGRSIADLFIEDGEPAFRELEATAVRQALAIGGVVAVGGGEEVGVVGAGAVLDLHVYLVAAAAFLRVVAALEVTGRLVEAGQVEPVVHFAGRIKGLHQGGLEAGVGGDLVAGQGAGQVAQDHLFAGGERVGEQRLPDLVHGQRERRHRLG